MLVDSSETARRFYALALRSQGYEIISAPHTDGLEEILRMQEPLLVLVDMKLPGSSPYDLCRQIHAQFPNLPIILLAERDGAVEPVEQRWAISRGASDLLQKHPDQIEPLLLKINQLTRGLSSVDRPALRSALQALQAPVQRAPLPPLTAQPGPVIIQHPQEPAKTGIFNTLQNAWQSIQTKPETKPEAGETVVRYRGSIVSRRPAPSPTQDLEVVRKPEPIPEPALPPPVVVYRGSAVNPTNTLPALPEPPAATPPQAIDLDEEDLDENQPRKRRRRESNLGSYRLRGARSL